MKKEAEDQKKRKADDDVKESPAKKSKPEKKEKKSKIIFIILFSLMFNFQIIVIMSRSRTSRKQLLRTQVASQKSNQSSAIG